MFEEYIVRSFLDQDFYEFTMGNLTFGDSEFADAIVTLRLICRTPGVKLGKVIPAQELEIQLDHAMNLPPTNSEIYYLRGMDVYGDRMFSEPYLQFLKTIKLPPYKLSITNDGDLELEFRGPLKTVSYWEIFALEIVNELYFRYTLKKHLKSAAERERYLRIGETRFLEKVKIIKRCVGLTYSDFGTRRRAFAQHQDKLVGMAASELPNHFRGTSNVYLAQKYNLTPMGTCAHKPLMIAAGLADIKSNGNRDVIRESQNEVFRKWWNKYGLGLSIILPETFGSKFTFETAFPEMATDWKGTRHDSGDRLRYAEKVMQWYQRYDVDPKTKMIVFSDGLTLDSILQTSNYCRDRIGSTFGWGTNLTNDFELRPDIGLMPLSLVVKPTLVSIDGQSRGLVKLSDNIAKATGKKEDIERYKKIFDYDENFFEACTY